VPRILSRHATYTYSWMKPPSRSRRNVWLPESSAHVMRPAEILVDEAAEAVASLDFAGLGCSALGEWS
jgi:hypothetical protein